MSINWRGTRFTPSQVNSGREFAANDSVRASDINAAFNNAFYAAQAVEDFFSENSEFDLLHTGNFGSEAGSVCEGNDPRLCDARESLGYIEINGERKYLKDNPSFTVEGGNSSLNLNSLPRESFRVPSAFVITGNDESFQWCPSSNEPLYNLMIGSESAITYAHHNKPSATHMLVGDPSSSASRADWRPINEVIGDGGIHLDSLPWVHSNSSINGIIVDGWNNNGDSRQLSRISFSDLANSLNTASFCDISLSSDRVHKALIQNSNGEAGWISGCDFTVYGSRVIEIPHGSWEESVLMTSGSGIVRVGMHTFASQLQQFLHF